MVQIKIVDYTTTEGQSLRIPDVRFYDETKLKKISEESGYSILDIKAHIAHAKINRRKTIVYLTPDSLRSLRDE